MVIDAEVVSRTERTVDSGTPRPSASRSAASPAASPSDPAKSDLPQRLRALHIAPPKPSRKPRGKKVQGRREAPIAVPIRGLVCPVCLEPAAADRQVQFGPVHAYLCDRCGGFASGAMQMIDFFKRFK
jgi:hypothetical protein